MEQSCLSLKLRRIKGAIEIGIPKTMRKASLPSFIIENHSPPTSKTKQPHNYVTSTSPDIKTFPPQTIQRRLKKNNLFYFFFSP